MRVVGKEKGLSKREIYKGKSYRKAPHCVLPYAAEKKSHGPFNSDAPYPLVVSLSHMFISLQNTTPRKQRRKF
jgi:hypothetical protein